LISLLCAAGTRAWRDGVDLDVAGGCQGRGAYPIEYLKDLFVRRPAAKITQIKKFASGAGRAFAHPNPVPTGLKLLPGRK